MILAQGPTLADFGQDVWWISLIKIVGAFVFAVVMTLLGVWFERRVVARMQVRPGPNRVGPLGLLQTLADGIKMAFKEDVTPRGAEKVVYFLAPTISVVCAITMLAVIPFGPIVSIFGQQTPLQVTDVPVAVLLVLALSAMSVYGVVLGGWASGSPYPLLGGLRASAQMISYEVSLGLSVLAVFLVAGTLSTSEIVQAQANGTEVSLFGAQLAGPGWYAVLLLPSFAFFAISVVAETNRAPFDLPEAESELVAGFMTEYSSLKFALFMLAEYVHMATAATLVTTLFLGGWRAPAPITTVWAGANAGWWPLLWFLAKVVLVLFVFVWLRGTLPRLRYDQLMRLGWKVLIPLNLVWIVALAGLRLFQNLDLDRQTQWFVIGGVGVVLLMLIAFWPARSEPPPRSLDDEVAARPSGSFPLPPMDLVVPPSPRARRALADKRDAAGGDQVGAGGSANGSAAVITAPEPADPDDSSEGKD